MSEQKIVELEEKIAFLQNMIDELNMVVFRQGEKLEKLNLKLKDTNEKLLDQSESILLNRSGFRRKTASLLSFALIRFIIMISATPFNPQTTLKGTY